MINKENLWFLTLFSLILVLSVYYVTMPNDLLVGDSKKEIVTKSNNKKSVSVKETSSLVAMRVSLEEERQEQMVC